MDKTITFRAPAPLRQRLEALADDPPAALAMRGSVSPSTIAREALARGLVELEREREEEPAKGQRA